MTRLGITLVVVMLSQASVSADQNKYIMNFDLNTQSPDGSVVYSIQLQGIHLDPDKPFHGDDLGEYDYFLTVTNVEDNKGKLTVELYQYESRKKVSDVVSEVVAEVDFTLGNPAVFEATSETFGVELAFSIDQH